METIIHFLIGFCVIMLIILFLISVLHLGGFWGKFIGACILIGGIAKFIELR